MSKKKPPAKKPAKTTTRTVAKLTPLLLLLCPMEAAPPLNPGDLGIPVTRPALEWWLYCTGCESRWWEDTLSCSENYEPHTEEWYNCLIAGARRYADCCTYCGLDPTFPVE